MSNLSQKQLDFLSKHCGLTGRQSGALSYKEASSLISNKMDEWRHGCIPDGDDADVDYDYDNIDPMDDWVAGMGHGDR